MATNRGTKGLRSKKEDIGKPLLTQKACALNGVITRGFISGIWNFSAIPHKRWMRIGVDRILGRVSLASRALTA